MSVCTIPPAGWACARDIGHDGPCAAIQRQAPIAQNWSGHGKYTLAFGFEPGALNIKLAGHGASDGDGEFVFTEECLEWDEDQETGKQYRWVSIANSELLAFRDRLNEIFPLAPPMTEERARELFLDNCPPGDRGALQRYGEKAAIAAIMAAFAQVQA